jgi:hypothetical protein
MHTQGLPGKQQKQPQGETPAMYDKHCLAERQLKQKELEITRKARKKRRENEWAWSSECQVFNPTQTRCHGHFMVRVFRGID